ncbi:RAD21-N-terminal like protein [Cryptosporidium ryanae]|uniref:RAD21-N-terminal like protein n=1 Tax=Cryptosporidium ryanae TaxID=515981 RepID=UPI00351A8575|nr:RAD21-N-terminal like protein [Cryptosporidium ryanae]
MESNKESSVLKYIKSEALLNLWITAYYEKRIKKKQLVNIDIKSTVKEIIKLTNTENEWIPLRISSGLLFGIVKVYHHKVDHLDNKCILTLNRMQNFNRNFSNIESVNIRKENEYFEKDIDRHKNNKLDNGMIDIDEINKDLDNIRDDKIDHLEIVPLSQNKENNQSQQLLDLTLELQNNENNPDYAPIIFDMEFDDFIDNQNEYVNMEIDNFSENQIEVESIQEIENLRGEAINFDEIVARGIEEINQNQEKNMSENDDKSERLNEMNDGFYHRTSIEMYNSPKEFGNNRESIGGISSTLEMFNVGNRFSISSENEELFYSSKPLQTNDENITRVIVSKVNEAPATGGAINRKRKKMFEIDINLDKEMQISLSNQNNIINNYLRSINNITLSYKNSNIDILKINKILPIKIVSGFLFSKTGKNSPISKNVKKRNLNNKNLGLNDNINTSITSKDVDTIAEDNFSISFEEFGNNIDNDSIQTPIRYSRRNMDDETENNELIFTPWTKYVISQERGHMEDFHIDQINYKRKMESLFSSREIKTMEFLNSKFSKNKVPLIFSELINGSEASTIAPIFVQILHLKSKSLIEIKQDEPFGEIHIYPQ